MKFRLNENSEWHEYFDYVTDYDEYNVLQMLEMNKNLWVPLIKPAMYQQALNEFVQTGKLEKFPTKYIYQWMGIIMKNTAIIRAITSIAGHDMGYPTDRIKDAFFYDDEEFEKYKQSLTHKGNYSPDFGWMENDEADTQEIDDDEAACQYLEDNGYFDKMTLPDGTPAWSDYGLQPLEEIIMQYNEKLSPEQVLVLINKALDVTHQRGDLASAFIEGGWRTLSQISDRGYINEKKENMKNDIKTEYTKYLKPLFDLIKEEEGIKNAPYPKVVLHTKIQEGCDPAMIKTGYFDPETNKVHVYVCDEKGNRSIRDILATFCHEAIHYKQQLKGEIAKSGYSGEKITEDDKLVKLEEEAYLKSGIYLRKFREKMGAYDK